MSKIACYVLTQIDDDGQGRSIEVDDWQVCFDLNNAAGPQIRINLSGEQRGFLDPWPKVREIDDQN